MIAGGRSGRQRKAISASNLNPRTGCPRHSWAAPCSQNSKPGREHCFLSVSRWRDCSEGEGLLACDYILYGDYRSLTYCGTLKFECFKPPRVAWKGKAKVECFILEEGTGDEIIRDLAHRSTKEADQVQGVQAFANTASGLRFVWGSQFSFCFSVTSVFSSGLYICGHYPDSSPNHVWGQ